MIESTGAGKLERRVVTDNLGLPGGAHLLSFADGRAFVPGQNVSLTVNPAVPARHYSLASGAADPVAQILFDLVPSGVLTPHLAALRPGDPLYVSAPFGGFLDDGRPATWIAAGTGVAPFASMVRSGLVRDKTLVHSSRSPEGLAFRELLASRLGPRYIPCCPGEAPGEGIRGGGLRAWVRESELGRDRRFLLCGSSRMVVEVRDLLIARGVPFEDIAAEIYF